MKAKSIASKSSEPLKSAQSVSKPASASKKPSKSSYSSSNSILEQVYRLPLSKRTEALIKNSVHQQRLSSEVVNLVGSTFRLKNQTECNSSLSAFESYRPLSKGSNLSDTLETLYEEDAESSRDSIEILYTDYSMPDDFSRREAYKTLDPSQSMLNYGSHSYSSHDLHREMRSNAIEESMYSTAIYKRREAQTERLSCSPTRKRDSLPVTWENSFCAKATKREVSCETSKNKENLRRQRSDIKRIEKVQHQYEKSVLKETQKNIRHLENKIERLKESSNLVKDLHRTRRISLLNSQEKKVNQEEYKKGNPTRTVERVSENRKRTLLGSEENKFASKIRKNESKIKIESSLNKSVEKARSEPRIGHGSKKLDILKSIQNFDRKLQAKYA